MKAVLMSIQPKWCELIASGKKTVEVRKTKPKLDVPFKVYIYCTNTRPFLVWGDVFRGNWETEFTHLYGYNRKDAERIWDVFNGKVMGEFVCTRVDRIQKLGVHNNFDYCYLSLNVFGNDDIETEITDIKKSCITKKELNAYGEHSPCLYAWHISNLVIYDTPKSLGEFKKHNRTCYYDNLGYATPRCKDCKCCQIKKPPQSWCYVEELG